MGRRQVGIIKNVIAVDPVDLEGFAVCLGNATDPLEDDTLDIMLREPLEHKYAGGYEHESSPAGSTDAYRHRLRRAAFSLNEGFSVVAPMSCGGPGECDL